MKLLVCSSSYSQVKRHQMYQTTQHLVKIREVLKDLSKISVTRK